MRGPRESCLAFYSKFKRFDITYFAGEDSSFKSTVAGLPKDFKTVTRTYCPKLWGNINNLSLAAITGLENLIKETDTLNISDTYYSFNSQAVNLAKKYKKKIVTIVWTTIPNHISSWLPPYSFFTKNVVSKTDFFILRNKTAYKFTDSLGIDRGKTVMIYKGVDLKHFFPKKNNTDKLIKILYIGIYHESKGIKDLINAFERIFKGGYRVELHLAGRGSLENYINNKSKTLPIVNHGFIPYDKLGDLYRLADIFCSPSKEIKILGVKTWEE
jgi:glycosyltransferase involved in cell wall biosynthesis